MSGLQDAYKQRLQLLFWIIAILLIFSIVLPTFSTDIKTGLVIILSLSLLLINIFHFWRVDSTLHLDRVSAYVSPSLWISILLQIYLAVLLVERFVLDSLRNNTTAEIIQFYILVCYIFSGLYVGTFNIIIPAYYRYQQLQKLENKGISNLSEKRMFIRTFIEKSIVDIKAPKLGDNIANLSIEDMKAVLEQTTEKIKPLDLRILFDLDEYLKLEIQQHEISNRPVYYLWASVLVAAIVIAFQFVASILNVLNLYNSLVS